MPFVLVVILQCTGTEGQGSALVSQHGSDTRNDKKKELSLPHRNGLGNGVDVIVLVFGPVIQSACESVQTAVVIHGLWRQLQFPTAVAQHAGFAEVVRLGLCVVRQQVVVEFRALKLALKGPRCAGVRLGDIAVVARRGRSTQSL